MTKPLGGSSNARFRNSGPQASIRPLAEGTRISKDPFGSYYRSHLPAMGGSGVSTSCEPHTTR